ncbi:MAG: TatD family nuclease-associated radical SAM protein [Eubacterium sp.]
MIITYEVDSKAYHTGRSLYVNLTNKCSNQCVFCLRYDRKNSENSLDELWLEREPTKNEILEDILKHDLSQYSELIFCGYGEPTYRLKEISEIAKTVKKTYPISTRINTNGQANLIHHKEMTSYLKDAIDVISISLNAKNAKEYQTMCHSQFDNAFDALLDFAKKATQYSKVYMTIVDILSVSDQKCCKTVAESVGAELKIRKYLK